MGLDSRCSLLRRAAGERADGQLLAGPPSGARRSCACSLGGSRGVALTGGNQCTPRVLSDLVGAADTGLPYAYVRTRTAQTTNPGVDGKAPSLRQCVARHLLEDADTPYIMCRMAGLKQRGLTQCERELRRAVEAGESLDLRSGHADLDDPARGAEWGPERTVRAEVLYQLLVRDARKSRAVVLLGTRISGGLNLEAATLACPFVLDQCFCDSPTNLQEARAETIRLTGCKLVCVAADRLETRGNLVLSGSTAAIVSLQGARVGGNLILNATRLTGGSWPLALADAALIPRRYAEEDRADNMALVAGGLSVDGDMFCRHGFAAHGQIWLVGARVGRQLIFDGAALNNENRIALFADRLNVGQNMFCREAAVMGAVQLRAANVNGQLAFDRARLRAALDLTDAKVLGGLWLRFDEAPTGEVVLERAEVGAVHDDEKTWPSELSLRGFTYGFLEPSDAKSRLRWVKRDPKRYAPQPYEQLVACYRRAGDEQQAREVAIEKQRRRRAELSNPAKAWSFFLGGTVGHGYRPGFLALWLLALIGVGWVGFARAYPQDFKKAEGTGGVPEFQPLLYTLDSVLPVLSLDQRETWIAEGLAQYGALLLTLAGFVLATVGLAALTGIMKKD
jgi:hypothetical protein